MEIYRWVVEHSDILGLLIESLSLFATVLLTIAIYLLERRHEKDREKAEKRAQKLDVIDDAKVFLIDNDEEIEYLPLAEIASKLKLKRKHCRNLITRYLRCNELQQQEILGQANIPDIRVSMNEVQTALKNLQADLDKYKFGNNILYDNAKYLHRAFERWSEVTVDDVNPYIFENLLNSELHDEQSKVPWISSNCDTTLSSYMWDYLHPEIINVDSLRIEPPIDMVFKKCNLGNCDESTVTFWVMRIIIDACQTIKNEQYEDIFDESLIQTQEDMYYYTLAVLCKTYDAERTKKE